MATTFTKNSTIDGLFALTGLTTSENTEAITSKNGGFLAGCIAVKDGGGTGFNSGTVTVQASPNGSDWYTAKDVTGTAMTLTADGYFEFSLAAYAVRVLNDGSVSDVDVDVFLT